MSDSLYSKLCVWDNLLPAYRKAAKGKRSKIPVADFEYRLEDNLVTLRQELQAQSYRPGPYHSFFIHGRETSIDQCGAASRPGGSSCSVQRHRAAF